ncbi:phosphatase PAP2 family protein [Streptomyces sp. NPDC057253]|uniref:phosphatase PAP2 family protein n=1 Tax=Streptomyces sp. NPDC057253 TaxID=3346069 RepID=UPI00363CB8B3
MIMAFDGASVDGTAYPHVVRLARHTQAFGDTAAVRAPAMLVVAVVGYGVDALMKPAVREDRPCQSLRVKTPETCPAPGDWSFPSNHAAIAAAAVALLLVSPRLGAVAAVAMAASRVWVGALCPYDVVAGVLVGGLVALTAMLVLRRWSRSMARWIGSGRLHRLLSPS